MMWVKPTSTAFDWAVYNKDRGANYQLKLNTDGNETLYAGAWDNTDPTDSVFTVGGGASVNPSGAEIIAYLFASVPGICDIGTFKGAAAIIDVDCGFTNGARFVLIKCVSANGDWCYFDTLMGIADDSSPFLRLNTTGAKQPGSLIFPFSKGFKVDTNFTGGYPTGADFIYMAIA
jgi:hypothetical protein